MNYQTMSFDELRNKRISIQSWLIKNGEHERASEGKMHLEAIEIEIKLRLENEERNPDERLKEVRERLIEMSKHPRPKVETPKILQPFVQTVIDAFT